MKFLEYIKDNIINIIIYSFTTILITLLLRAFKTATYVNIIIFTTLFLSGTSIIIFSYLRKYKFYKTLLNNLEKLDKKYLVLETMPDANTYEEKIMVNCLYDINKSMIENINLHQKSINEFKEFIEIWIHEVKIPISSMVLKCHNHKEKYNNELLTLIRRLDDNIDQILYYVRSEDTEKDFMINTINLKEIIRDVSLKNKDDLLENNISLEVNLQNLKVSTDKKWLEFILNQIINNSIKYKKGNNSLIKIESFEEKDKIILSISDNGTGIPTKDIKRVFDKSFTGTNGRDKVKSTGMGLYIVKKLCDKLGHNIYIESKENVYTKVIIEFGKNNMYKFWYYKIVSFCNIK